MNGSDPRPEPADAEANASAAALEARVANLAAELALRDRELAALRDALASERTQAQAARALIEAHLQEAGRAETVRRQLEETLGAQCDERARLLADAERALDELRRVRESARAQAAEAERALAERQDEIARLLGARDAEVEARARVERERDEAQVLAAEAQIILAATEHRIKTLGAELATLRADADEERERLHAAAAAAEAGAEAVRVELAAMLDRLARLEAAHTEAAEDRQRLATALRALEGEHAEALAARAVEDDAWRQRLEAADAAAAEAAAGRDTAFRRAAEIEALLAETAAAAAAERAELERVRHGLACEETLRVELEAGLAEARQAWAAEQRRLVELEEAWSAERQAAAATLRETQEACAALAVELECRAAAYESLRAEGDAALAGLRDELEAAYATRATAEQLSADAESALRAAEQRCGALRADAELQARQTQMTAEALAEARDSRQRLEEEVGLLRQAAADATALHQESISAWEADSAKERRERERLHAELREREGVIERLREDVADRALECQAAVAAGAELETAMRRGQEAVLEADALRARCETLSSQVEAGDERVRALEAECTGIAERAAEVTVRYEQLQAVLEARAAEWQGAEAALAEARQVAEALRVELAGSAAQNRELAAERDAAAIELRRAVETGEALRRDCGDLGQALEESRASADGWAQQARYLTTERDAARADLAAAAAAHQGVEADLRAAEALLEETGAALRDQLETAASRCRDLENELLAAGGASASAQAARAALEGELEAVRLAAGERSAAYAALHEQFEALQASHADAAMRLADESEARARLAAELDTARAAHAELEVADAELRGEVDALRLRCAALDGELVRQGEARSVGDEARAALAAELDGARAAYAELDAAGDGLRGELEALGARCAALEEELLRHERARADGEAGRAALAAELASAQAARGELDSMSAALREELDGLRARCGGLEDELVRHREARETAEAVRAALAADLETAQLARAELETAAAGLRAALADAVQRSQGLESTAAARGEELRNAANAQAALAAEVGLLRDAEAALRVALDDADARARVLATERDGVGDQLAAAERERAEVLRALDEAGQAVAAGHAATAAVRAELSAALATLTELDARRAEAESRAHDALALRDALAEQLASTEARLAAAEAARGDGEAELGRLRAELGAATSTADVEALMQLSEDADRARLATEQERDALREHGAALAREHEDLSERVVRLEEGMLAARDSEARALTDLADRAAALEATRAELARVEAARDRLGEELGLAQQQLDAQRAESEVLAARSAAAERAVEQEHERQVRLQEQALQLQEQLLEGEAGVASIAFDRDEERRGRETLQARLDEQARVAAEHGEQLEALRARAATAECERDELRTELRALEAARQALAQECENLRRRPAGGEDDRERAGEVQRLRLRLEELEHQQADAAQRHSQAVSLYMLELNQRTDALHQRELEQQKLEEQLRLLEQACEDGTEQLAALRQERDALERQVDQADTTPTASSAPLGLRLAGGEDSAARPVDDVPRRAAAARPAKAPEPPAAEPRTAAICLAPGETLTLVHVEEHAPLRELIRGQVEGCPSARYTVLADVADGGDDQHLLAVNLLARDVDPIALICDARWRHSEPRAFTYLAAGARGVVAGLVDFVPFPIEPDGCATRLLERPGGTQRLLMVSDKIEAMNEIRAVLNRVKCSTSLALDGRQAFDLVGMVKPDVILIDLTLPRAEGLRLVSRLRADPKTSNIGLVFALGEPFDAARFRTDATRVLGDCRLTPEDLSGALAQVLSEVQTASDELRATA